MSAGWRLRRRGSEARILRKSDLPDDSLHPAPAACRGAAMGRAKIAQERAQTGVSCYDPNIAQAFVPHKVSACSEGWVRLYTPSHLVALQLFRACQGMMKVYPVGDPKGLSSGRAGWRGSG